MFLLSIVTLLFISCSKTVDSAENGMIEKPSTSTDPSTINKTVILQLVNEVRRKGCQCGDTYYSPASSVAWSDQLEQAAYNHSMDMFQKNYFNHIAPNGAGPGDRIKQTGYNWKAFGENIGMGYKSEREVVDAWIKSPSHCQNLMGKMYKEMGVARVGNYWTQDFGAK